jgi:heme exporter protein B
MMGLIFFLAIVTLIPFALGPDLNLLSRIGPAILWIAALLATLIGLDRVVQADQ